MCGASLEVSLEQSLFRKIVSEKQFQIIVLSKWGILMTYENQALGPCIDKLQCSYATPSFAAVESRH